VGLSPGFFLLFSKHKIIIASHLAMQRKKSRCKRERKNISLSTKRCKSIFLEKLNGTNLNEQGLN
jgi:hypothetical protein